MEGGPATTFDQLASVKALKDYYDNELSKTHLRDLLNDHDRNQALRLVLRPNGDGKQGQDTD
jgi:hypothetical protein